MRKITFTLTFLLLLIGFSNCSDNDDNGNNSNLQEKVGKQIEAVVNSLSTNESVNAYRTSLSKFNTSAYSFDNESLTLFVFTDDALNDAIRSKATISFEQKYLAHHMASGFFNLESLKGMSQIKLLDGTTADIVVTDKGNVYINGVELKSPQQVSNSIVYIIDKIIPEASSNDKLITFNVLEVNDNWSETSPQKGFPSAEAEIVIYQGENSKVLTTDNNGIASFTIDITKNYTFSVEKGDLKDLHYGWIIKGIFTTQQEINDAPDYGSMKKELGALMLDDTNGDGKIDDEDKTERRVLNGSSSTVQVFIAEEESMFTEPGITDEHMQSAATAYNQVKAQYISIDNTYSTLESRQSINPQNQMLYTFWKDSYYAIGITNTLLLSQKESSDQTDKKNLLRKYRADLHYYLTVVFGNIVIADKRWIVGEPSFKQVSFEEALDFVEKETTEVYRKLPDEYRIESLQLSAILGMQKKTSNAYKTAYREINEALSLSPTDYLKYIISAECSLELGKISEALYDINIVLNENNKPELPSSITAEELRDKIHGLYDLYASTGLKYPNIIRWGKNATWGKYSLMPINQHEIETSGGSVKQNPGW